MNEFRCSQCGRLLARIDGVGVVEIKCPRCKSMNRFSEEVFITIEQKMEKSCIDPEIAEN